MRKGRIPKDILYGELEKGTRKTGCPLFRFKDVCKRDMKSAAIGQRSLYMAASRISIQTGNQACQEYMKHATSGKILEKPWTQYHYLIQISNVKEVIKTVILVTKDVVQ